jgi:NAD(P)-dependent dehydrogenase (short-subunit alcohol dehydrogenase family)
VTTFADTGDEDWRQELELKFFSQILPIRAFQPLLERAEAPAVVGVNSLLAYQPEPHMVCTSAARAGVQSLLKSLATEFAPRIRVNTVLLGLVDSGQWQRRFEARADRGQGRDEWFAALARNKGIPLGRLGAPEEPARAIVFLGSPAASYITGASLEVSGGVSRHI